MTPANCARLGRDARRAAGELIDGHAVDCDHCPRCAATYVITAAARVLDELATDTALAA